MRKSIAGLVASASLIIAMPVVCPAQEDTSDAATAMAGDWLVAPEDGRNGCRVKLGTEAAIGGMAIEIGAACEKALPEIADAVAWRFSDGGLALADATHKTILTFAEGEDASWATAAEIGQRLLLTKAPPGVEAVPNANSLSGAWSVLGPAGKTICSLMLSGKPPPGSEANYGLTLAEGCHDRILKLKLGSWRVDGMAVMLFGTEGESLHFEADGKGGFTEFQAANGKPLRLARP